MKLEDTSLMPFGKFRGLAMQDVPVDYLHFLWHSGLKHFLPTDTQADSRFEVAMYIRDRLSALKTENEDLIWS